MFFYFRKTNWTVWERASRLWTRIDPPSRSSTVTLSWSTWAPGRSEASSRYDERPLNWQNLNRAAHAISANVLADRSESRVARTSWRWRRWICTTRCSAKTRSPETATWRRSSLSSRSSKSRHTFSTRQFSNKLRTNKIFTYDYVLFGSSLLDDTPKHC